MPTYPDFDLEAFFSRVGVDYRTDGKNVGSRCVGVCCPFCGDGSYHLGVFRDHKNWVCLRCRRKGSLSDLLKALFPSTWRSLLNDNTSPVCWDDTKERLLNLMSPRKERASEAFSPVSLPSSIPITASLCNTWPPLGKFLAKRRITVETCSHYGARLALTGRYTNRLVIPIEAGGRLVSFQARDLSGQAEVKYDCPPKSKHKEVLYPLNDLSSSERVILVEGPLDAWRMGPGTVCSFGTLITSAQKRVLQQLSPKEVIFCWDSRAYWKAREAAKELIPLVPRVRVARLPHLATGEEGDPDTLGYETVMACVESAQTLS